MDFVSLEAPYLEIMPITTLDQPCQINLCCTEQQQANVGGLQNTNNGHAGWGKLGVNISEDHLNEEKLA